VSCDRIIVSAGGTGGHIIPALNVSLELLRRGVDVHFIGNNNSMEYDIITKNNIPFHPIDVQKLYRNLTWKHIFFPFKLIKSVLVARRYFKELRPDAFIGFGGFVSGAPAIAAYTCRCPLFIQEQNCRPGITNRFTGKFATAVFAASEASKVYFKGCEVMVTGNPVRVEDKVANATFGSTESRPLQDMVVYNKRLLVLGGSQGSLFINNLVLKHLDLFSDQNINLIWQTGKRHIDTINEKIKDRQNITTFDFTDKMQEYYAMADLVICRGGALTLAELDIYRVPALVIPLSTAAVNEQYHNAVNMASQNKCEVLEEKDAEQFAKRFIEFVNKAQGMYAGKTESIHLTAIQSIVDFIVSFEDTKTNKKTNKKQKPLEEKNG